MKLSRINENIGSPIILREVESKYFGKKLNWFKWSTTPNNWGDLRPKDITDQARYARGINEPAKLGLFTIPGFVGGSIGVMGMHYGLGGSDSNSMRPCLMTGSCIYSDKLTTQNLKITDYWEKIDIPKGSPAYQGDPMYDEYIILERVKVQNICLVDYDEEAGKIGIYNKGDLLKVIDFEEGR
jgi:hypothetical protein